MSGGLTNHFGVGGGWCVLFCECFVLGVNGRLADLAPSRKVPVVMLGASAFTIDAAFWGSGIAILVGVILCSTFGSQVVSLRALGGDVVLISVALIAHQ